MFEKAFWPQISEDGIEMLKPTSSVLIAPRIYILRQGRRRLNNNVCSYEIEVKCLGREI
jgi:hypothetical protein